MTGGGTVPHSVAGWGCDRVLQGVFRVGRDATQYRSQNTVCGILAVCAKSMGDAKKGVAGVAGVAGIFSRTARPPPKQLFDTVFEVLLIAPRDFRA